MERVLVLGSNGLVGKTVTNKLNNSTKISKVYASTRSDANLFLFDDTYRLIKETSPNIIINAAAKVGGIQANNTQRTDFILENLKINMNLLESIKDFPDIKIINLGSSCIYPLDADNPIVEDSFLQGKLEPTNAPYAMAKITAIEIGRAISHEYGNNILNLMPTNLYGPFDHFNNEDSHVIPGLFYRMNNALENKQEAFKLWGTGTPLREFLYSEDLADAIEFLLDKEVTTDLINIGSNEEISIKDLAYMIKDLLGYEGEIIFDDTKPDGNPRKLLDSSLINSLGWKSSTSLEEGLLKTYNWFKDNK
jgi:GDP-L-fucose synthase